MSKSAKDYLPIHTRLSSPFEEQERKQESHVSTWSPPVDIQETKEAYVITAEVPGMTGDDFKITIGTNWLNIRGDRKSGAICTQENWYRLECVHGRFHRCFEFPDEIDPQGVAAILEEGILEVNLLKKNKQDR